MLLLRRQQPIPSGFTVKRHADDYAWAMELLKLKPSVMEYNSAGGPIGQWPAADLAQGLTLCLALLLTPILVRRSSTG